MRPSLRHALPRAGLPFPQRRGLGGCARRRRHGRQHECGRHSRRQPGWQAALVSEGTALPGAAACPVFPADSVWEHRHLQAPGGPAQHRLAAQHARVDDPAAPGLRPEPRRLPRRNPLRGRHQAHKTVQVKFRYASESNRVPYPLGPDTPIEGGKNAPSNTDRHALMVNKSTCTLYELWQARTASGSAADSGAVWNLRSDALRPAGWTSADAVGPPILPGLLNFAQIQAAVRAGKPIKHAIRFTADNTAAAYIWPARHARWARAASRPCPHGRPLPAQDELQRGGGLPRVAAVLRGRQGRPRRNAALRPDTRRQRQQWYFQGSAYPQWPDALVSLLKQIPAKSFVAVNESCLMVNRNSGQAKAHAGCPIG